MKFFKKPSGIFALALSLVVTAFADLNAAATNRIGYRDFDLQSFYDELAGPVAVSQFYIASKLRFNNPHQWEDKAKYCAMKKASLSEACCLLLASKVYFASNETGKVMSNLRSIEELASKMSERDRIYLATAVMYFADSLDFYTRTPSKVTIFSKLLILMEKFAGAKSTEIRELEVHRLTVLTRLAQLGKKEQNEKKWQAQLSELKAKLTMELPTAMSSNEESEKTAILNHDYKRALALADKNLELSKANFGPNSIRAVGDICIRIAALNGLKEETLAINEFEKLNDLADRFVPLSGFACYDKDVREARTALLTLKNTGISPGQIDLLELISFKLSLKGQSLVGMSGLNNSFQDFLRKSHPEQLAQSQALFANYLSLCDLVHDRSTVSEQ